MDDSRIIELFWRRSESAISETDEKYGKYCRYISYQILGNESDANEIVNDTYLKTWNTIPPKRPESLKSYVGMIARQLSINRYEKDHTQKRSGEAAFAIEELYECVPDRNGDGSFAEKIALRDSLNEFISSLPELAQRVFVRRYWYAASIAEISREYSIGESRVTVILTRTRRKLKKHLEKGGF